MGACMFMDKPIASAVGAPAASSDRAGGGKHVHPDDAAGLIPSDHYALRVQFRVAPSS